jgi:hypothetical protein
MIVTEKRFSSRGSPLKAAVFALHEIDLASTGLLPTTCLRLADGEHFVAVNRIRDEAECPGVCEMPKHGIAIVGNTVTRRTPVTPVRSLI